MTRRNRILLILALVAIALLLALRWLAQPRQVAALVLDRTGAALGLEITATGAAEYRMRGTPMLVLRDVVVRQPGSATALLRAGRIHVALPWSTLRSGGAELVATRIDLDQPRLDLPALQRWRATRPPTAPRLPTLTRGFRVRDGVLINQGWRIDGIHAEAASLDPGQPLRMRLRARYLDAPLSIPVDAAVALTKPEVLATPGVSGFAAYGRVTIERSREWRMPAIVRLSGPLHMGEDMLQLAPARLGMAAALETGDSRIPFALGLHGPLRFDEATWRLAPAGIALRGRGETAIDPVPAIDATGGLVLGTKLQLHLDGRIAQWPPAWPALPPPIGQSDAPLPFALRYDGGTALADIATLRLARDGARFDGRFRLPQILDWTDRPDASPLPPLSGSFAAPQLEIAGARFEGVTIEFENAEQQ